METLDIKTFEQGVTSAEKEKEISKDWVPVTEEPQHHHRFKNEFARVYDVRFKQGEHSLYHKHTKDTFYVSVYHTKVYDQTYGEKEGTTHDLPAGMGICRGHGDKPLTHQVRNDGEGLMQMIGAEHLKTPEIVSSETLDHQNFELLDNPGESDKVRLYHFRLEPGESTEEVDFDFYSLMVALTDSSLKIDDESGTRTEAYTPGIHTWSGPRTMTITNVGELAHEAIIGEWR